MLIFTEAVCKEYMWREEGGEGETVVRDGGLGVCVCAVLWQQTHLCVPETFEL